MRSLLPWLAALAPTAAAISFPHIQLTTRQTNGGVSEIPSNITEAPAEQATFEQDNFGQDGAKLVFAITTDLATGDIRFRMGGPSMYSWVAFGIGPQMKGSLMFVMYPANKQGQVTLSARLATGQTEPAFAPNVQLESVAPISGDYNNTVNGNMFYQSGYCKACMTLAPNQIDPNSTAQPFIFAVGPRISSYYYTALDAPLRRHWFYGNFQLNIANANTAVLPTLQFNDSAKEVSYSVTQDNNFAESTHVFVMVLTFVIIMPLALFFIRSLENVTIHMTLQGIALLFVIIGFASGIITSKLYIRAMHVNTAHQVIGILVFIFILAQWLFGFVSHRRYVRTGSSIKWMMKTHKLVLGPLVFALGIVNIPLGFRLALVPQLNWVYLPVMFIVLVLLVASGFYKNWFMRKWGGRKNAPSRTYINGPYGPPTSAPAPGYENNNPFATRSDIALSPLGEPPAYEAKPHQPREFA